MGGKTIWKACRKGEKVMPDNVIGLKELENNEGLPEFQLIVNGKHVGTIERDKELYTYEEMIENIANILNAVSMFTIK